MKVHLGKYRKNRVAKVQIDAWDTWSLDGTLAEIIHPALIKFKTERQKMPGVPSKFFHDDDPVKANGNPTDEALELASKRFENFLDESIWAFGEIKDEYPGEAAFYVIKPEYAHLTKEEISNMNFVDKNKNWITTTDFDREGFGNYHKRIQAALREFGENYQTLWW